MTKGANSLGSRGDRTGILNSLGLICALGRRTGITIPRGLCISDRLIGTAGTPISTGFARHGRRHAGSGLSQAPWAPVQPDHVLYSIICLLLRHHILSNLPSESIGAGV